MSLVYAVFVPHSPLLIPTIGKENLSLLKASLESFATIREHFTALKPDLVVLISPHGTLRESIQGFVSERLTTDFKQFGDLKYIRSYQSSYFLLYQLKKKIKKIPFSLINDEYVDYGVGTPLILLTSELGHFPPLTVLRTSTADELSHFRFGEMLGEEIYPSDKRIVVIASGELARTHQTQGQEDSAKALDHSVIQKIKQKDIETLIKPNKREMRDNLLVCGSKPLALLFGVLGNSHYRPKILSYEHPFGVGLLTVEFLL